MKRIFLALILLVCLVAPAHARYQDWWQIASAAADAGGATFTVPVVASGSMKVDSYTVYHTGNFPGATASDSDKLDGYHASTSAAINTVVVRSSTGNILTTTASTTGNATVGGTLGVTGKTTTGTLESGAATFTADIDGSSGDFMVTGNRTDTGSLVGVLGRRYVSLGSNMYYSGGYKKISTASRSAYLQVDCENPYPMFYTSDAGSSNAFQNGSYAVWHGGMTYFSAVNPSIYNRTSDGSDDGTVRLYAGGDISSSRGALIVLSGNEHATTAGRVRIQAGNVSGSGTVDLVTGAGSTCFQLTSSGDVRCNAFNGGGTTGASLDNDGDIIRTPSDLRLKENIIDITAGLDKVRALRGVTFNWKDKASFGSRRDYGMIAQEVEAVIPEVVTQNPDGMKSLDYQKIVPVLVEAIKDQQRIIESLESRINALEGK